MDEKYYETMLSKPPEGIGGWPLFLIVEFREAIYEASIALSRFRLVKGWWQTFTQKAEKVCGFYCLRDETEERRHHADW